MSLADRQAYPLVASIDQQWEAGMTFRERLIVALAANTLMIAYDEKLLNNGNVQKTFLFDDTAKRIISQADAIMKQLEEEKK